MPKVLDNLIHEKRVPVLIAMSDNGPQMRSHSTKEFMAACAIMQRFGRPGTPTDQAWIESLFSHVKADWPHLDRIKDPEVLRAELADVRRQYNTVRLHAGIGYITPNDEHQGRGPPHLRRPQTGYNTPAGPACAWVLGGAWLGRRGAAGRPGESPTSPRLRCLAGRT